MKRLIYTYILLLFLWSCENKKTLFIELPVEQTHVTFNNYITESDSFNILDNEYLYNGGGVGLADFNNDGLIDVFLSGNMAESELYLNQGKFSFINATSSSGINLKEQWSSGVALVDINNDGWKDIYVCGTNHIDGKRRTNRLYINKGIEDGLAFEELASEYGLADSSHTTTAAFFDYDKDGILDVYLLINERQSDKLPNKYISQNGEQVIGQIDKLLKGVFDENLGHLVFQEVTSDAGIDERGFGLGVNITDLNLDGWPDIYVTNDFLTSDLLYINQQDGTFKNQTQDYFKHTSYSAMGNTVADLNNDGLVEVIAVDMLPEDNYRRKMMLNDNNYPAYQNFDKYGYQHQYVRNTLQLNQGKNAISGLTSFSDIALQAGISSTDWSWTPMAADFDLDGYRDLIITNGFPKDITDQDFIAYHQNNNRFMGKDKILQAIPEVKIKNYAFRNSGNARFENATEDWGITNTSFSNGAAFADLDNDGDLDYVVNNINAPAFVFENKATEVSNGFKAIQFTLTGSANNPEALGTKVFLKTENGETQFHEYNPFMGYLSSSYAKIQFAISDSSTNANLLVIWPDGKFQELVINGSEAEMNLDYINASGSFNYEGLYKQQTEKYLEEVNIESYGIDYVHSEKDFNDFNIQKLLIEKLSEKTAKFEVADVNNDGLDDIYFHGSSSNKGVFYLQNEKGQFDERDMFASSFKAGDETYSLFFDADGDNDLDFLISNGGNEQAERDSSYQNRLFINKEGKFYEVIDALPVSYQSSNCLKYADYDQDGDLDLFIGAGAIPDKYPMAGESYILENISTENVVKFQIAQKLDLGIVKDAVWEDMNGDGTIDLFTVGHFATPKLYTLENETYVSQNQAAFESLNGMWNCVKLSDLDGDGDLDLSIGNLGTNTLYSTKGNPFKYYVADFDKDGILDAVPSTSFISQEGFLEEYPYFGRKDMRKQMNLMAKLYTTYESFANTTMSQFLANFPDLEYKVFEANYYNNILVFNDGSEGYRIEVLPQDLQISSINDFLIADINKDGFKDILSIGNSFGMEVATGRQDAFNGGVLLGNSDGNFEPRSLQESGFYVPNDAQNIKTLTINKEKYIMVSQHRSTPKLFKLPN